MAEPESWSKDFKELRSHLDLAFNASYHFAGWVRAQLGSPDLPEGIGTLVEEISKARLLVNQLYDRLYGRPLSLLLGGYPMSREAYYLLVALAVMHGGSYTGDPYGDFQMLRYEDDERQCYISLDEVPPAGEGRIHLGMSPEEIWWERLSAEQRDFFGHHLPDVAARFKRQA
jgi:hypothetical protein